MITNRKNIDYITVILLIVILTVVPFSSDNRVYAEVSKVVNYTQSSDVEGIINEETPASYSISFVGNGGKVSYTEKSITQGGIYGSLPKATKSKYKFLGWYTKKNGGMKIKSDTIVKVEYGKKLYAHWKRVYLVVINAGHQAKGNSAMEPIGPGSKNRKNKVAYGTSGVATKVSESERVLQIAKKLKKELKNKDVKVYMVRTKQNVNISNAQRARVANGKKADLVISIHCDASGSSSVKGITMLVPQKNKWTKKFYSKSLKAGQTVQKQAIKYTKAHNRGISKRGDLTGFNWSKVPTILIETGFMTNQEEDKKLAQTSYRKKLAKGMSIGIVKYLKTQK